MRPTAPAPSHRFQSNSAGTGRAGSQGCVGLQGCESRTVCTLPNRPLRTHSHAWRLRDGAILGAHLNDTSVTPRRRDHLPAFVDRPAERLLAVDVLTRPACQYRNCRVPVVGRGHQHRVDVPAVQDPAEILVGITFPDAVLCGGQMLPIHVAHRRDGACGSS